MPQSYLPELRWRGLFSQATNESGAEAHLASGRRSVYIGFDPTADSLTIGNLVQIILLRHVQLAGHRAVVVMGGGTGLIGDPSGKSAERELLSREKVEENVRSQKRIFERVLEFGGANPAVMTNNLDWLGAVGYLEALRDIGKHFSVNMMMQKDSVRERLESREQGISYTEFSYMVLQAYDFLHLNRAMGVTVQMGGSDQYGNIVAGIDLIRRVRAAAGEPASEAFGITTPLVTKADGGKFGKTESGAVWLTADRTSPYAFHQFWLNTSDADVVRFLKIFTFLPRAEIEALAAEHASDPGRRAAHRALAHHMTAMLHGESEAASAEGAARALFSGDIASLPAAALREVLAEAPTTRCDRARLGAGVPLIDLLVESQLAKSKREAREFLASGSVTVNGAKAEPDATLTGANLLHGSIIAMRRGKKAWAVTVWE